MAHLLVSSALFKGLSCESGSFSYCRNRDSPQPALSLSFPLTQPLLCSLLPRCSFSPSAALLGWLFCLTVPLILWSSEFHAVSFSGTSGYLLILDWLLSSFWLCEEVKGFYLCLHLGQNLFAFNGGFSRGMYGLSLW